MTKNNNHGGVHCLIVARSDDDRNMAEKDRENASSTISHMEATLAEILDPQKDRVTLLTVPPEPAAIIEQLLTGKIHLFFVDQTEQANIDTYKKLLIRYSLDTLLITHADHFQPLVCELSGLEMASIPTNIPASRQPDISAFIKILLSYAGLKGSFRACKQMLFITDQRNRELVNISPEPIAYLYKDVHVHANAAYLSVFGFQSVAELKSTVIDDLIPEKSRKMFHQFVQKQSVSADIKQTLLMTLKTVDGRSLRAAVRVAPAVLRQTRCMQLWVHKIEENPTMVARHTSVYREPHTASPWEELPEQKPSMLPEFTTAHAEGVDKYLEDSPTRHVKSADNQVSGTNAENETEADQRENPKKENTLKELRETMKPVKLKFLPLTSTDSNEINHYFVKLQFDVREQQRINEKLKKTGMLKPALFRDRLLVQNLGKQVADKAYVDKQLLLSLGATSLLDNAFVAFLIKHLRALPRHRSHLVFLIPDQLYKKYPVRIKQVAEKLRSLDVSLGVYDFVPDKHSLHRVLRDKPAYISFLPKWTKAISSQPQKFQQFTRLTAHLERKGIETILV